MVWVGISLTGRTDLVLNNLNPTVEQYILILDNQEFRLIQDNAVTHNSTTQIFQCPDFRKLPNVKKAGFKCGLR